MFLQVHVFVELVYQFMTLCHVDIWGSNYTWSLAICQLKGKRSSASMLYMNMLSDSVFCFKLDAKYQETAECSHHHGTMLL